MRNWSSAMLDMFTGRPSTRTSFSKSKPLLIPVPADTLNWVVFVLCLIPVKTTQQTLRLYCYITPYFNQPVCPSWNLSPSRHFPQSMQAIRGYFVRVRLLTSFLDFLLAKRCRNKNTPKCLEKANVPWNGQSALSNKIMPSCSCFGRTWNRRQPRSVFVQRSPKRDRHKSLEISIVKSSIHNMGAGDAWLSQ